MGRSPAESLEDRIEYGAIKDIIAIEEAIFFLNALDPYCDAINDNGFGHLVATIQRLLLDQVILVGARLFESEKGFPLRTLPAAVTLLGKHAQDIPLSNRDGLLDLVVHLDIARAELEALAEVDLTQEVVRRCRRKLKEQAAALEPLVTMRNKLVAHREQVDNLNGAEWAAVVKSVEIAKRIVAVIDRGYLSGGYLEGEIYPLTEGARLASKSMLRLLRRASVIDTANLEDGPTMARSSR